MQSIFIGSTGGGPGQTLATWALAVKLKEKGKRVGFFKPYGLLPELGSFPGRPECDSDVFLLKQVLGLPEPEEILCPVMVKENVLPEISGEKSQELIDRIQEAFQKISAQKDVVLIMGAKEIFFGGELSGLSDSFLVKSFDASVLLVDRYQGDNLTLYSLLSLNSFLDGRVKAAFLNHIPPEKWDHVKSKIIPFLQEKGLKSVVPIPEDPMLAARTVSTIAEIVEGEILCCPEHGENLIETFTIGSKPIEANLSIFRQVYNKIVLVGLASGQEPKTVGGMILTGGKLPSEMVLRVAQDRSIPLILTPKDTFQTLERLEKSKPSLGLKDEFKVRRFLKLIEQELGTDPWLEALL